MKNNYPSLSILTLTYNPRLDIFRKSLNSIKFQDYPKEKIEHIIIDGGSGEETIKLAKEYNCIFLIKKEYKNNSEGRRFFGVKKAKNEIIIWLESDNVLPNADSLKKLVEPFINDPQVFSTFTLHYTHDRKLSLLDRYCGLIGAGDPVVFYLNKADRRPWFIDRYDKGKIIKRDKGYDVVEFDEENLPTVGDNGFLVKRQMLLRAKNSPAFYFHTDVFVDLLRLGYNRFGVVNSTAIAHIGEKSILRFVRRRTFYMKRDAAPSSLKNRRYTVFNSHSYQDIKKLILFVFYTVTIIQPISVSIRGYLKIKDKAWFMHPFICLFFLVYYAKARIEMSLKI